MGYQAHSPYTRTRAHTQIQNNDDKWYIVSVVKRDNVFFQNKALGAFTLQLSSQTIAWKKKRIIFSKVYRIEFFPNLHFV